MPNIIKLHQGELLEGETVEFVADFSCNSLSNFFTNKRWHVLGEKNLQFNSLTNSYYNVGETNIFESVGDDYITVSDLKVGRYLVMFTYTDLRGQTIEEREMVTVFPNFKLVLDSDIEEGSSKIMNISSSLLNLSADVTFSDNGEVVHLDDGSVTRTFPLNGYHTASIEIDYSNAKYDETNEPDVVWLSQPSDKFVGVGGPFGGGTRVEGTFKTTIEQHYLTKIAISTSSISDKFNMDLDIALEGGVEAFAPTNVFINDNTKYFTLSGEHKQYWDMTQNLPTDDYVPMIDGNPDPDYFLPLSEVFEGDDRIDYTEVFFGDGQVIKGKNVGFNYQKNYKESGLFQIKYVIHTKHYVSLTEETTETINAGLIKDIEDGRLYYTNTIEHIRDIEVKAFFTKWLREHVTKSLFNGQGWNDLTTATGKQLDRVYNQAKSIIDSIDVETISDNFIRNYFETYGDFEDIAVKVGFKSYTNGQDSIFDSFEGYNFFDRLERGKVSSSEKAEFLNYIRKSQERLKTKGTPASIERELQQFDIVAEVVELWTDNMDRVSNETTLIDEVFSGKKASFQTGLTYEASSTPISDNTSSLIVNSKDTPYIEINSNKQSNTVYYTKDNAIKQYGCQKYVEFKNVITVDQTIEYVFESLFDQWADQRIGNGLWARKYTSNFEVFGNFTWNELNGQTWGETVIETLRNIGTEKLYKEFVNRWGELGTLVWNDFNFEAWEDDIEADSTFVQGVSGETIVSLDSGQIIFGEYTQKSFDVGTTYYFRTTGQLIDAYIKDYHGTQENMLCAVEGISGLEWDSDLTQASFHNDEWFHYKVTIPSKSNYFKGWVFNKDDGVTMTSDAQFRVQMTDIDITTVVEVSGGQEESESEESNEVQNNLNTFQEAYFKCVPSPPTIEEVVVEEEEIVDTTEQYFADQIQGSRMVLTQGELKNASTISAFNKKIIIGDRTKQPSGLKEGEYAYFASTVKLTYATVKDIMGNEAFLEYNDDISFIKPTKTSDLANATPKDGVYFYRWRVNKDNFIFHETSAFTFRAASNFDLTIYNESIYDTIVPPTTWSNMKNIEWGKTEQLTWEHLFIGDDFGNIIFVE